MATKYVARVDGWIVGKRTTERTYSHAVVVSGHGVTNVVKAWCGRPDLADTQAKAWRGYGYRVEIVPAELEVVARAEMGRIAAAKASARALDAQPATAADPKATRATRYKVIVFRADDSSEVISVFSRRPDAVKRARVVAADRQGWPTVTRCIVRDDLPEMIDGNFVVVIVTIDRDTPASHPTIHEFNSTGEAYDACQCYDEIKKGDVLLIKPECVVGIADTWPVAVTMRAKHLHEPDASLCECFEGRFEDVETKVDYAKQVASWFGWQVRA